jgi:hypothetical protein
MPIAILTAWVIEYSMKSNSLFGSFMFIFVGRASVLPLDQSGEALPFIIERMGLRIRIVLLALQPSISFC